MTKKTHSMRVLEHNALYRDDMTDFEYDYWEAQHNKIAGKKSLIGF